MHFVLIQVLQKSDKYGLSYALFKVSSYLSFTNCTEETRGQNSVTVGSLLKVHHRPLIQLLADYFNTTMYLVIKPMVGNKLFTLHIIVNL